MRSKKITFAKTTLLNLSGFFLFCCLVPGAGRAAGDGDWSYFRLPGPASFSISVPGKLQKQKGKDEWRAGDAAGRVYSIGMGYYTEPAKIADPQAFMKMMVNRMAANTGSRVAYCWFFKQQNVPACEFKLVNLSQQQVAAGRYFLVHQWFYFLDFTADAAGFDVIPMKRFFESFQIINPALSDFQP